MIKSATHRDDQNLSWNDGSHTFSENPSWVYEQAQQVSTCSNCFRLRNTRFISDTGEQERCKIIISGPLVWIKYDSAIYSPAPSFQCRTGDTVRTTVIDGFIENKDCSDSFSSSSISSTGMQTFSNKCCGCLWQFATTWTIHNLTRLYQFLCTAVFLGT